MDLKELFKRTAPGAAPASEDPVQTARTRARQRLVGAALLLVAGVVAFPLLFETKPRSLALDTPIVAARTPGAAEPAGGAPAPLPVVRTPPVAAASAPAASAPAEAPAPLEVPVPADTPASAAAASGKGPPKPGPAAPVVQAAPAPAAAPAAPAAPAAATGSAAAASAARAARYVVQVGAFSEATTAREVRLKVERLGLKTYTQVVETEGGKRTRVRVGPFASREEAMQTLARIQSANLPGVVLAL
jgi:DedD protein